MQKKQKFHLPKQYASAPPRGGSGLVFAVILLFVILGGAVALSSITVLETKMSQKAKSSVGAFYNSESGVEWALNKIASSSGTLSPSLAANPDGSVDCPISPNCKVYFLKEDGTVISRDQFTTTSFGDVKAVRSVGSQGDETQRAIEAAVTVGGGCYVSYIDDATDAACALGFVNEGCLGDWGFCTSPNPRDAQVAYFRPPAGECFRGRYADEIDHNKYTLGNAYLCCQ